MNKPKMIYTDESIELVVRKFIEKFPDKAPNQFLEEFSNFFDASMIPAQKFISYIQQIKREHQIMTLK